MSSLKILSLIVGIIITSSSLYIGYALFFGTDEKKSHVSLITKTMAGDIFKFISALTKIVLVGIIIYSLFKIIKNF